jgi:hypothetical protein
MNLGLVNMYFFPLNKRYLHLKYLRCTVISSEKLMGVWWCQSNDNHRILHSAVIGLLSFCR